MLGGKGEIVVPSSFRLTWLWDPERLLELLWWMRLSARPSCSSVLWLLTTFFSPSRSDKDSSVCCTSFTSAGTTWGQYCGVGWCWTWTAGQRGDITSALVGRGWKGIWWAAFFWKAYGNFGYLWEFQGVVFVKGTNPHVQWLNFCMTSCLENVYRLYRQIWVVSFCEKGSK